MKYKIPVHFEVSALLEIEAKNPSAAIYKSMDITSRDLKDFTDMEINDFIIPVPDNQRLEEMYPKEMRKMKEDERPWWEKKGWKEVNTDCWTKGNITITNGFDDVGWGFKGTVSFTDGWSKGGFNSLEDAVEFAENNGGGHG